MHCFTFENIYSWFGIRNPGALFWRILHPQFMVDCFSLFLLTKSTGGYGKSENDLRNKDWEKQIDFLYCHHKKQRQREVKKHQRRGLLAVSVLVENPVVSKWFHVRFPSCHRVGEFCKKNKFGIILELHLNRFIKWSKFIDIWLRPRQNSKHSAVLPLPFSPQRHTARRCSKRVASTDVVHPRILQSWYLWTKWTKYPTKASLKLENSNLKWWSSTRKNHGKKSHNYYIFPFSLCNQQSSIFW